MMLDENLRKKMGEAFEDGNFEEALKLSKMLDKQILKHVKVSSNICSKTGFGIRIKATNMRGRRKDFCMGG